MTVIGLMHRLPDGSWIDPATIVRVWIYPHSKYIIYIHVVGRDDGFAVKCDTPEAAETALAELIPACDQARLSAMTPDQRASYFQAQRGDSK